MPKRALPVAWTIILVSASLSAADVHCASYDADNAVAKQLLVDGRYREAVDAMLPLIHSQTSDQRDCDLASTLNNLALSYQKLGRYREAEQLFRQSLKKFEERNDATSALVLTNLLIFYVERGQVSRAKTIAKRLQTIPVGPGRDVRLLFVLGSVAALSQEYRQAEQFFQQALALRKASAADQGLEFAVLLYDLARVRLELNHSADVEELLNQSMTIISQTVGSAHPLSIGPLTGLAQLNWQRNRPADAAALLERALRISRHALGTDHATTGEILMDYSVILKRLGRKSDAREAEQRAKQIAKSRTEENFDAHTVDLQALLKERRGLP